jgi:hypothetical protein
MTNDDRNRQAQNQKRLTQKNNSQTNPAQNYLTSPAYINGVAAMATLCRGASTC